ncbi:MAG: hypothetical protein WD894_14385 [Pirellulales bacterium]
MEKLRVIGNGQFKLVGQLAYELGEGLTGAGIRLYQGVDPERREQQFLCLEDAESGNEEWYRLDGTHLEPVSLQGLERLPQNPR